MKTKTNIYSIFAFCILFIIMMFCTNTTTKIQHITSYAFNTSAKAMALIDANSGRLLAEKNSDLQLKMASTTKIATAITVIDNCPDLDERFRIDDRAIGIEGTSIYLQRGEMLTCRELLYGLMLRSGNDASVALALHCAKSVEDFAGLMNQTAQKAGAQNTHFVNPHGLDADEHYTTAFDLALITAYAMKNPIFKEIVSTKTTKIPHPEYTHRFLANKNKLLGTFNGCVGVKTGFTKGAGRCFVGAAEKEGATLICVVLNCGPMFEECSEIFEEGFKKYKNVQLIEPYSFVRNINVENGTKSKVKIYCPQGFSYLLSQQEQCDINIEYDLPNTLEAPIKQEAVVGKVSIFFKNQLIFQTDLLTMEEVESEKIIDQIKGIIDKW